MHVWLSFRVSATPLWCNTVKLCAFGWTLWVVPGWFFRLWIWHVHSIGIRSEMRHAIHRTMQPLLFPRIDRISRDNRSFESPTSWLTMMAYIMATAKLRSLPAHRCPIPLYLLTWRDRSSPPLNRNAYLNRSPLQVCFDSDLVEGRYTVTSSTRSSDARLRSECCRCSWLGELFKWLIDWLIDWTSMDYEF